MSLRLRIVGVKEMRAKLIKLDESLRDEEELWDRIAEIMVEVEQTLFATEGATASPPWPPLQESTIAKKMRQGLPFPEMPMIATGALMESLTTSEALEISQGRSTLGTFTTADFTWGTAVENERGETYAEFHQEGLDHNPNLPVRNVINVTPELLARINRACDDFLDDAVREAGMA